MAYKPQYITTKVAAERLGISVRRVRALIQDGQLEATKVGDESHGIWIIDGHSLEHRLFVQEAQKAWALLGIPKRLWGTWYLAEVDEIETFQCPRCGGTAYSPAGATKYSDWDACPDCGWVEKSREETEE